MPDDEGTRPKVRTVRKARGGGDALLFGPVRSHIGIKRQKGRLPVSGQDPPLQRKGDRA